ncbi:MAG: sensor histidine kinase, partial [bacterium]
LDLAAYFRRNLVQAGDFCTLQEELRHVRAYLALEQARFGPKLQLVENVPDEYLQVKLPRLTLEPLVENAVKHGIAPQSNGGQVSISAYREGSKLYLEVKDTGVGMTVDTLEQVRRGTHSKGIGLTNVTERLKNVYGPEFALTISSVSGAGCRVSFAVPLEVAGHERLSAS